MKIICTVPGHFNVIYAAPQESNSHPNEKVLASSPTGVTKINPSVNKPTGDKSIPPVTPSFLVSVLSQGESFEGIIPKEIKDIIHNMPHDSGQKLFNFIMLLGTSPKPLIDKLLQENKELRQLQKESVQNTQQVSKIMELTEQVQSLTKQNEVMNKIIDTQIPLCTPKFSTSTQTDVSPETVPNRGILKAHAHTQTPHKRSHKQIQTTPKTDFSIGEIVQKECVSSDTQTIPVKAVDFSNQAHICCKEHITSEFQCQVSLNTVPHLTQETQTQPIKSVDFCSQTNITEKPKSITLTQNSPSELENQQLKEALSQLQSEYSSLQELHENLNEKYQEALEYCVNTNIQVEDQTEEIAQLKNHLVTLQEKYDKLKEHENLVCDKYNSLIPQFNLKISAFQKTIKDLHRDNYLLNKVLEKICPDNDTNNPLNSSAQSDESSKWVMVTDSTAQTEHIPPNPVKSSKTTGIDSSAQTTPIQNNDSSAQTNTIPPQKSLSPTKRTKSSPSRRTSPQPNIPISQIKITTNFKRFKCAWCSEEKHPWNKCQQWNSWNLWQKQQATQILEKVKKGNLHPNVPVRPQFQLQRRALFSPIQVKRNNDSLSKTQWEKQMKINENVQEAGLMKVSNSFYVPQCSVVMRGVKSSSLCRSRTTPNSK